ncbi:MAG: hypothetical protein HUU29_13190 [Planctomycetaceae bacterium]|nr:hypothetical protein [Planctomycetaceae bacterium]
MTIIAGAATNAKKITLKRAATCQKHKRLYIAPEYRDTDVTTPPHTRGYALYAAFLGRIAAGLEGWSGFFL